MKKRYLDISYYLFLLFCLRTTFSLCQCPRILIREIMKFLIDNEKDVKLKKARIPNIRIF
jgi:hypothetical protein